MTVYAKIEDNKLVTAYNGYNGIIGLADSPELCLANGFTAYEEDENGLTLIDKYFAGSCKIIDGALTDISQTSDYKAKVKAETKKQIQEKYKSIMDKYVCAKVKRDLFETAEYQSMITDMYAEIGAL